MPVKSGHRVTKIILLVIGIPLLLIIGGVGCLLLADKFLEAPEWSACSPGHQCKGGLKCVGKICSSGKLGSYCESQTDCSTPYCINKVCKEDIKIGVFTDEEPLNPNNLKKIKIAVITVRMSDGNLSLDPAVGADIDMTQLKNALDEIRKRPALTLTSESERIINGQKVLAMEAREVVKDDTDYAYAVRETLAMEFGLQAEVEH